MYVANFTSYMPEMAHSRTYEGFSKFLGENPKRLGIVSRMQPYDNMTALFLTEGLNNVVTNKQGVGSKYQKIDATCFTWEVELNQAGSFIL